MKWNNNKKKMYWFILICSEKWNLINKKIFNSKFNFTENIYKL